MRSDGILGTVGILTAARAAAPGFASESFCRELCAAGRRLGLDVFVFTPDGLVRAPHRTSVRVFRQAANGSGWRAEEAELPDVVYDRHFAASPAELDRYRGALRLLAAQSPRARLLGGGLPGKRAVQRMLARDPALAPHLPPTATLRTASGLLAALKHRGELFLKPDGGSQGRGALRVNADSCGGPVIVRGRTPQGDPFTRRFARADDFASWLMAAVGSRPYLIQPYLPLVDREGIAYDIRCLMQKDGSGRWQTTGIAARRGRPGSVTANLHGGGTAEPAAAVLEREFGAAEAARIEQTLRRLAARIPTLLEEQRGRLCELGIDFGVASGGRVWLIEVNSKPGRAAFARIGGQALRQAAVENPLRYAWARLCSKAALPPLTRNSV